jgi:hypothetical protein
MKEAVAVIEFLNLLGTSHEGLVVSFIRVFLQRRPDTRMPIAELAANATLQCQAWSTS